MMVVTGHSIDLKHNVYVDTRTHKYPPRLFAMISWQAFCVLSISNTIKQLKPCNAVCLCSEFVLSNNGVTM